MKIYNKSNYVELYDIVVVKHLNNNNKIYKFEIVNQYVEKHRVFVGFGRFGSVHKEIIDKVEKDSKNISYEVDSRIASEAGIGKALINKKIGDITKTNTDIYEIVDIIKYQR